MGICIVQLSGISTNRPERMPEAQRPSELGEAGASNARDLVMVCASMGTVFLLDQYHVFDI